MIIVALIALESRSDEQGKTYNYIAKFLHGQQRLDEGLKLVPQIERAADRYEIDPLLIAVTIAQESAFYIGGQKGKAGERGLMQVMPHGVCGKGQDLKSTQGQILAGARCLAMARTQCGDDARKMICAYMSGRCLPRTDKTARKVSYRYSKYKKATK